MKIYSIGFLSFSQSHGPSRLKRGGVTQEDCEGNALEQPLWLTGLALADSVISPPVVVSRDMNLGSRTPEVSTATGSTISLSESDRYVDSLPFSSWRAAKLFQNTILDYLVTSYFNQKKKQFYLYTTMLMFLDRHKLIFVNQLYGGRHSNRDY